MRCQLLSTIQRTFGTFGTTPGYLLGGGEYRSDQRGGVRDGEGGIYKVKGFDSDQRWSVLLFLSGLDSYVYKPMFRPQTVQSTAGFFRALFLA